MNSIGVENQITAKDPFYPEARWEFELRIAVTGGPPIEISVLQRFAGARLAAIRDGLFCAIEGAAKALLGKDLLDLKGAVGSADVPGEPAGSPQS